jgi:hypothetical protein
MLSAGVSASLAYFSFCFVMLTKEASSDNNSYLATEDASFVSMTKRSLANLVMSIQTSG